MSTVEDRLRDAMAARARMVPDDDRDHALPAPRPARPYGLGAAAVALAVAATVVGVVRLAEPSPGPGRDATGVMPATSMTPPPDLVDVSVFLCTDVSSFTACEGGGVTGAERRSIRRALETRPDVGFVVYEDRRAAWENFRRLEERPAVLDEVTIEDIPASFRVRVTPGADPSAVARAASRLPGVSNVVLERCLWGRGAPSRSADECGFPGRGR